MKTAEEVLEALEDRFNYFSPLEKLEFIKDYANQVAQQALKDAADNMDKECDDFGGLHDSMKNVILSTPIVTP